MSDFRRKLIANLNLREYEYYIASWDWVGGTSQIPTSATTNGSVDFLKDLYCPYLIDHTDNSGTTTHVVGELQRNNYLRFKNGKFAPTVVINESQRSQCDVALYLDNTKTTLYSAAGAFNAETFYNTYGMSQKLYDASGNEIEHILRPWETTELKYSVMYGNKKGIWVLDDFGNSGLFHEGILLKYREFDGIVPKYLPPTALSMSPFTTITYNSKVCARNMFYLYQGMTNCQGNYGYSDPNVTAMFHEDRTYPRVNDVSHLTIPTFAQANNSDTGNTYPFAEGGHFAYQTFIQTRKLMYGTTGISNNGNGFTGGIDSTYPCNSEDTLQLNGGVKYKESGTNTWNYAQWVDQKIYVNSTTIAEMSYLLNSQFPKTQTMEMQMALSYAVEQKIPTGTTFTFYGDTYRYSNVGMALSTSDGYMNAIVYKTVDGIVHASNVSGNSTNYDIEAVLKVGLMDGMDLAGDVFAYTQGGYEMITTVTHLQSETRYNNPTDIYLETDQTKWVNLSTVYMSDNGKFDAIENVYPKLQSNVLTTVGPVRQRYGYTCFPKQTGALSTGEYCDYTNYYSNDLNMRVRLGSRRRGYASWSNGGARISYGNNHCSYANRISAGLFQVLI